MLVLRTHQLLWWGGEMMQEQLFCFSSPADGTPTWATQFSFKCNCVLFQFWIYASVYVCVGGGVSASCANSPTAVCRELCDRAQGAEGPLRAAVGQSGRVAVGRGAVTFHHTLKPPAGRGRIIHRRTSRRTHLILKKLLKEELPLLPKTSSFSRF